jgi:hypothetical protein
MASSLMTGDDGSDLSSNLGFFTREPLMIIVADSNVVLRLDFESKTSDHGSLLVSLSSSRPTAVGRS